MPLLPPRPLLLKLLLLLKLKQKKPLPLLLKLLKTPLLVQQVLWKMPQVRCKKPLLHQPVNKTCSVLLRSRIMHA
jgi:hypothetical protein